jgi:hypothetical protein
MKVSYILFLGFLHFMKNDEDRGAKSLVPSLIYSGIGTIIH